MKEIILTILFLTVYGAAHGQDPRFSQFNSSPLLINPAMTGVYDGSFRVTSAYRDQWSSILGSAPFKTISFGAEYKYNVNSNDFFGVGMNLLQDEVGVGNLKQTRGHLSAAYVRQIAGGGYNSAAHHFGVGFQVGAGQNSLDWTKLWFSDQYNPRTESIDIPTIETILNNTNVYLDINAGVIWYMVKGDNSIYAGGAMHHINAPVISHFNDESQNLHSRYVGQLGAQIMINRELDLMPSMIFMKQGPSNEIVIGSAIRYDGGDRGELAMRLGGYLRAANKLDSGMLIDAFIVAANFEISGVNLGISYDINISSLNLVTNSRGAAEVTLSYIKPSSSRRSNKPMGNPRF